MSIGCEGGDITYNLKVDTSEAATNITDLNRLLTTYVALARKMGLPENLIDAIVQLQQMRLAIEATYRSLMLLYTASGPYGWAIGLGGLALSGFMLADQMEIRRPRY